MNIKVAYKMDELDKAIWAAQRHFTNEEFEPRACRIQVRGLKPSEPKDVDWEHWMDCKYHTGLTEAEYQARYHRAWSA